jgi:hypothetical protein
MGLIRSLDQVSQSVNTLMQSSKRVTMYSSARAE